MEKRKTTITGKRLLSLLLIAAVVITLSPHLPGVEGEALAASASTLYITDSVGGESQTVTGSSSGTGWNWDAGTATLTLSSFDGSYIEANGDVKIILDGTNRITPANDAQYVIKADGVITIEKTSNDETDKLIIENNAMTSSSFRAIYGSISGGYKDTVINGGTVEIKIKNENSSTIYGGYYIYLYGSSNLKIDIDGYNVIGATGIYVNDSADVNVSVNAQTYATGTDHFSALGSGNVTMTATINGDYTHANAKAFDLDAGFSGKGMKLKPGGKVTAKGRISQWRDYNVQAIDDTVKTTPAARILKKESSTSNYLIYHDASGNPITYMTFEGTDTLQPMSFNNPGGLFNIPESEVGTRIDTIYLMSGLSSRNATFSLKDGSSLPDEIILSSSGRISGTPTAPAVAGTVTIVATRADTEPIEFEISYGEVKVKPTYITINADKYNMKNNASGTGWDWDAGTATLMLSSFNGSYIEADGDVKIILDGTNRITPANDAQYVIKADGVITIEKTSNDETDKLIIENNAMTSSSFRAIYGRSSGGYKDTIVNGGTVEIKIKNENSSTIYGGYYIYLYGSSNLKIDIDGYNVIGATGIYVNDSADVNVSVNAQTYATGTDHFSALGSGNVTMTATINGDYAHANAKAFDLDAGYEFKGMKLQPGGRVTAKGRISQWRDYNAQAIDDTVKTTPAARILKKESSTSNYLIYHDESGNPITEMTFEGTDTLQPMSFNNPGGLFNIPESEVGTRIDTIYLMSGLSSRNATFSLKDGSSLPDEIILSSSGRISGTPTTPAEAGTVTIVATRADTEPIEFEISYGEVKVKQPVTGVTLSQTELILNRYDSETLTAAVLPEDASIRTVSWNSSRSDIASVNSTYSGSETATVKGLSVGKATITVTTTQGNKQATCTVYVKEPKPNAGIDYINKKLTGLVKGASYKVTGEGITETTFTASELSYDIDLIWMGKTISLVRTNTEAKCNSDAQIIDIAAKPTATAANCTVTSDAVTVTNVITGQEYAITAKGTAVTDSDWKAISTSEYTFNGLAPNKEFTVHTRVKATAGNVASDVVTTEVKTDKLTQTITGSDTQKVTVSTSLTLGSQYSTNVEGNTLSYALKEGSSYPSTDTSMTSEGVITAGATPGTFTITITAPEYGDYKAASKEVYIIVTAKQFQYFNSGFAGTETKTYGDEPFYRSASLSQGNGAITYSSSEVSVATVDATGKVTILKAGTTTITATAAATEDYETETAAYTLTVNKADPVVPTNLKGTKGKALSTVTLPLGWAWADSSITMNTTGNQTFKANYTPADAVNYNAATNVDITVNVTEAGSGSGGSGGGGGGGGAAPAESAQKPTIEAAEGVKVTLSTDGRAATITVDTDYELEDVVLNGTSKGKVTEVKDLKTGDKLVVTAKKKEVQLTKEELITAVKGQKLTAASKLIKTKSGKKAITITWTVKNGKGIKLDGVQIFRSVKKSSGYGKKPIFTSKGTKYTNTSVKKGKRYYYKVRGFITIGGKKYYTEYSNKTYRTVK